MASDTVLVDSTPVFVQGSAAGLESDTRRGMPRDTVMGILFGTIIRGLIAMWRVGKMAYAVDSRLEVLVFPSPRKR